MNVPAASREPRVIMAKSILATTRISGSWTDPRWTRDLYVEAKLTMLLSIREFWHEYRTSRDRDRRSALRRLICLKVTVYRFFDSCGLQTC